MNLKEVQKDNFNYIVATVLIMPLDVINIIAITDKICYLGHKKISCTRAVKREHN